MFISIQKSREVPSLPNNYRKSNNNLFKCPWTGLVFEGNIYDTSAGTFVLGVNAIFVSASGRYFYKYWSNRMSVIGFYKHYIFTYSDDTVYVLSFDSITPVQCPRVKDCVHGQLSISDKYGIKWNIYPWDYREYLAQYLTSSQKKVIITAHLSLKRLGVAKDMRHLICRHAFTS